eukprot:TRINITY_DN9288_c0_g1_i1.p1 TRINITY_DN9288_c0_g1~~TRINITY_DN9288_c0_g1_i1.p1  ORF type:complete len:126 (+),score=48.44 TRINITY_DN9288_c0_g1_i1:238-615(+)
MDALSIFLDLLQKSKDEKEISISLSILKEISRDENTHKLILKRALKILIKFLAANQPTLFQEISVGAILNLSYFDENRKHILYEGGAESLIRFVCFLPFFLLSFSLSFYSLFLLSLLLPLPFSPS